MAQPMRTLLQIVNAAQAELGLPQSSTVIGNSDFTTVQMLGLLQLAIEDLRDANPETWTVCNFEFNLVVNPPITLTGNATLNSAVITGLSPNTTGLAAQYWAVSGPNVPQGARILSVDSPTQVTLTMEVTGAITSGSFVFAQDTYAMPSDFRHFINDTWWDRTNRWQLIGPDSPQLDQWHRSGVVATGPRRHFRDIGPLANSYRLWPPPAEIVNPLQLVFEYCSNNMISLAGSQTNFGKVWAADTDQPLLDDRALIMALKWRFWEQKGLNYASKRDEYDRFVERLIARDGGSSVLGLVPKSWPYYLTPLNVQDGFFPGPSGNS